MRQLRIRAIARPAVREGVLVGIILGVILLVISLVANYDANISTLLNYILIVGGYGYAGYRATRVTRLVRTGLIAGIIAGSITYFISLLATMLVVIININSIRAGAINTVPAAQRAQYTNEYIIFLILFQFVLQLVIVGTAAGALFGALGGFMAKRNPVRVAATSATSDQSGSIVDAADPAQATITARRSPGGNIFTRRSRPTTPAEVVDAAEPAQEESPTAEEVESAPNEVTANGAELPQDGLTAEEEAVPARDEVETEERVEPSQDETVTGEVGETPTSEVEGVEETPAPTTGEVSLMSNPFDGDRGPDAEETTVPTTGGVKDTPTPMTPAPGTKKNYRSFLSQ